MKLTRYTKFTGDLSTSFDLEDLMEALSDFLLDSGFSDPWSQFPNASDSMEDLREAIRQALDSGVPPSAAILPMTPEEVEASYADYLAGTPSAGAI